MSYHFTKCVEMSFEEALVRVVEVLKMEGFGILTEIDVRAKMREKLGVEFRNYRILGACNPPMAYQALLHEDKIGTMLPCNVIVQETADGRIEVSAVDPVASMMAIRNEALGGIAVQVQAKLKRVIDTL